MNEKNTLALVAAAPLLYRLHGNTKAGWPICRGFECGDGWFDLLMRLSVKIEADLEAMEDAGKRKQNLPCAVQVKEKFGTLRFYVSNPAPQWSEWIEEAETESSQTCELCGAPGALSTRGGWYSTMCPRHLMLSGHVPGGVGEFYFLGSDECPSPRGTPREGMEFQGIIRLATGDLNVWNRPEKKMRGLVFVDELPPPLWPALSRIANESGEIPAGKVTNYLYANRWLPNVRAVLGLPLVEPGDFVEEAEKLIRHQDMELVGSVVLPGRRGAVPVFVPNDFSMKIVPWEFMPEWVAAEFRRWHVGAQHHLGPYWYDFQAFVRRREMSAPTDFLAAHPLLLLNPKMRQIEFDVPQAWMSAIERMADRMEATLKKAVDEGFPIGDLPSVKSIDKALHTRKLRVLFDPQDLACLPGPIKQEIIHAITETQDEIERNEPGEPG